MSFKDINKLFHAIESGNVDLVKEMNPNQELANAENENGLTALGMAAHFGLQEVVEILLKKGANVNALSHSTISFIPSNTALHAAIAGGKSVRIVNLLLKKGADINAVDSEGHTPIQAAAFEGNIEIAKLLIEKGANLTETGGQGSAYSIALKRNHQEFAELLRQEEALKK